MRAIAAHALDRILALVERNLVVGSLQEIDVERIGDAQQINEHVGELETHALVALRVERSALLFREPLKLLDELGDLDGQRHRQILRRVKLLPVSLGREDGEALL